MENDKYLTVSALTNYLKYKFDTDENLKCVFLKGEISNFKSHTTGHLYFSIKDENSKINAIMFSTNARKINFVPQEGTKVLLVGRVSVYPSTGNYQIYVDEMMEDGVGNLYVAFEKLKADLERDGLFKEEHKKQIPKFPKRVGVVTAPTGAAIRDIISTIKRRYPVCEIIVFPSLVQGEFAKDDIVRNIKLAENYNIDTLIVGRGGGSIEDLWPFNEEIVARAIYECPIPVISAVGHEVDFTIADFVADLRAPTPTGAAEIAVPNKQDVINYIDQLKIRVQKSTLNKINILKERLYKLKTSYVLKNPMNLYEIKLQKFDMTLEKLKYNINIIYQNKKNDYLQLISKLDALSPLNTIKRGYSVVKKDDKIIKSVKDVKKSDKLEIDLSDGSINVEVI